MKKRTKYLSLLSALFLVVLFCNKSVVKTTKSQIHTTIGAIPYRPFALVLGTSKNNKNGLNPNGCNNRIIQSK